jgi:UDP-N-acetyl-2-amino-2-deoxyglucuronate dehydrogenase
MTKGELGFALVGCGRIAKKHAEALSGKVKQARLIAVCDIVSERARALGEEFKVPYYASIEAMLEAKKDAIDVVNILTESGHHARDTLAVVPYKKHVVVEKPMALTLEDADAMIAACDKAGVKLFVVKQNRFNLPVQRLRRAVEQERFGKPSWARCACAGAATRPIMTRPRGVALGRSMEVYSPIRRATI